MVCEINKTSRKRQWQQGLELLTEVTLGGRSVGGGEGTDVIHGRLFVH